MSTGPLSGKTVLVACSEMKSARLADALAALGASVALFPVIQVREIAGALDAALDRLAEYSWVIFTSGYGASIFAGQMRRRNLPCDNCPPVCAIGPATAETARREGLTVDLVPAEFVAEGVFASLSAKHGGAAGMTGMRVLLPRARVARDIIPDALEAAGAQVDVIPCYENTLPDVDPGQMRALLRRPPDLLVFTSSSTVRNFAALTGEQGMVLLKTTPAAVLGPITAQTLSGFGKSPEIIPSEHTIPSLLQAIRSYYEERSQESEVSDRD